MSILTGARVARALMRMTAHVICIYACLVMTLNSMWSSQIFDLFVNPIFSGEIQWERVSWGPKPWDIRIKDPRLIDAQNNELARFSKLIIKDYNLLGLLEFTYGAGYVGLFDGHVSIAEREHSEDPERLIWNIAELFQPKNSIYKPDDGEKTPPILVQIERCDLEDIRGRVKMGVVDVNLSGAAVQNGFFELDTTNKVMRIRADELKVKQVDTDIFLRHSDDQMSEKAKAQAPIDKILSYRLTRLNSHHLWWLDDAFGGQDLEANSYLYDKISLQEWILDLSTQGVPHARAQVDAHLRSFDRYIKPWGLDQYVRGELKLQGDLNGPLDDPASRNLHSEGQIFVPVLGSIRFLLDGNKSRLGQVQVSQGRIWSILGDLGIKAEFNLPKQLGLLTLKANELIWSSLGQLPPEWKAWEQSAYGDIYLKIRPDYQQDSKGVEKPYSVGLELDLSAQGPKRVHLRGRASLSGDLLSIHEGQLELHRPSDGLYAPPRQKLKAQGQLDLTTQKFKSDLSLKGKLTPYSLPPLRLPLSAQIDLRVNAQGSMKHPKLAGVIKARQIQSKLKKYPGKVDRIHLDFNLDQQKLVLTQSLVKTKQGQAMLELNLPWKKPLDATFWAKIDHLDMDLEPFGLPIQTQVDGVLCTHRQQACKTLQKVSPSSAKISKDSCLRSLFNTKVSKREQSEACLSFKKLKLKGVEFKEFEINASLTPKLFKLRRGRLWKGQRLLLDFQGQIENPLQKQATLNSSIKLINIPLQLAQKFIKNPTLPIKTLYGTVNSEFSLSGQLSQPEGQGTLSLNRLSTRIDQGQNEALKLALGEAFLNFELLKERITAQGHIGKQLWVDGEFVFDEKLLSIGTDFHALSTSFLTAPLESESQYKKLVTALKTSFEKLPLSQVGLAPLLLNDQSRSIKIIGLGEPVACDWKIRDLPYSQLIKLTLQGRGQLIWHLEQESFPKIDIDLDHTQIDYWLRDIGGEVIRGQEQDSCKQSCSTLSTQRASTAKTKQPNYCPTLSLHTPIAYHMELSGQQYFGERLWLNPKRIWTKQKDHTEMLNKHNKIPQPNEEISQKKADKQAQQDSTAICPQLRFQGTIAQEQVLLMPIRLESGGQELELRFGLQNGRVQGCLSGLLQLKLLTPFLRDFYQQIDGLIYLNTYFNGPLERLALSGELEAQKMNFNSPRVKLLGDLQLNEAVWFKLTALQQGGTQLNLKSLNDFSVKRNEGDIRIQKLTVDLPKFLFEKLSVDFSAPQFDVLIPQMLRSSVNLRNMNFEMYLPSENAQAPSTDLDETQTNTQTKKTSTKDQKQALVRQEPKLTLSGDVKVIRALYHTDILSIDKTFYQGGINALSGRSAVESLSLFDKTPLLKKLYLDLRLQGDNEILVKTKIANLTALDLELNLDLKMKGKLISEQGDPIASRLSLSGAVDALEGSTLTISKNPFEISHAKVLFGGLVGEDIQSSDFLFADLVATHTFRIPPTGLNNRQINFDQTLSTDLVDEEVTLSGQLKMPTQESPFQVDFDLMSQSGRSRIEVLNLVLFGSYPTGASVLNNTQPATGLLLSPVLNFIERPIADSLGLDNLSLTPDSSSLFIDIDKAFSRRLRFNLRTQIGEVDPNTPQSIFLEYKINNWLAGEVTAEQRGDISTGSGRVRLRLSWD